MPKFDSRQYRELAMLLKVEHQHFLHYATGATGAQAVEDVMRVLAGYFAGDNPRFKGEQWLRTCGLLRNPPDIPSEMS